MRRLQRFARLLLVAPLSAAAAAGLTTVSAQAAVPGPVAGEERESAQEAYAAWCGRCHQFDGKGVEGLYPALAGSLLVTADAKLLARLVLDGGFANNAMPAFRDVLDDELAAKVLTYTRTAWGNGATPVTIKDIVERNQP
jgi:mono/diheme cytochrome c family protein